MAQVTGEPAFFPAWPEKTGLIGPDGAFGDPFRSERKTLAQLG